MGQGQQEWNSGKKETAREKLTVEQEDLRGGILGSNGASIEEEEQRAENMN